MLGPRNVIRQGVAALHPLPAFTEGSGDRFTVVAMFGNRRGGALLASDFEG
jgi:hypothetical protein